MMHGLMENMPDGGGLGVGENGVSGLVWRPGSFKMNVQRMMPMTVMFPRLLCFDWSLGSSRDTGAYTLRVYALHHFGGLQFAQPWARDC